MIQFKLQMVVTCDHAPHSCNKKLEFDLLISAHKLQKILKDGSDALEPRDLPSDWGFHTTGGWGMTDYTKTELLCGNCIGKYGYGTTEWGTNGPLSQIAKAAGESP